MNQIVIRNLLGQIRTIGRTLFSEEKEALFMNWTLSGIELEFTGTCLQAEFLALPGAELDDPVGMTVPPRETWPWAGIQVDGAEELAECFEIGCGEQIRTIWKTEKPETHRIRLVKLTENPKGMLAVRSLITDGTIRIPETQDRTRIEFVGDSITCGFGCMSSDPARMFWSEDENGWYSHAAVAGRLLNADVTLISYSGICTENHTWLPQPYGMTMLYGYRDRVLEDRICPEGMRTEFDFAKEPRDIVVINLGTNDATGIMFAEDHPAAEQEFCGSYRRFIEQVRRLNGPETQIICALGSINYMLWSDIEKTVAAYRDETGDEKVCCFRYYMMAPLEGVAPCGHPTRASQERMGREIAAFIQQAHFTDTPVFRYGSERKAE